MALQGVPLVLSLLGLAVALVLVLRRVRPAGTSPELEQLQDRIWRLSESEERYRVLVEATTEVIVQRDAQERITFANAGFGRLLGVEPLTLIGSTRRVTVLEKGAARFNPDGSRRTEMRLQPTDGPPRWFSFIEMPMYGGDHGGDHGGDGKPQWLCAGYDITERVEATCALDEALSRAEAANVAKSRFLATVSHEFRTPLNGILGMADLVLDTGLDPEQRTYVEAVRTSGNALLSLIDGILDFSRIEAGRLDLASEPFEPAAIAEGVVELLAPRAQDKGLEIAIDVPDDLPRAVLGDADRIRQILINLAGNAIKFTAEGGVGVALRHEAGDLVLAISDTGPGIPEARIPALFEEFEQGDGSASRQHEGTGLGLAITRRLVDRMGGRIATDSTLARGTTFTVRLPLPVVEPAAAPAAVLSGRQIMIVAASPFQAPYLARALARAGAAALLVSTVEAALDALTGLPLDAIIVDRALGDGAIPILAKAAKRRGVRCCLVLLSPFDRREFGAPGSAGFDSYLVKPVRTRSLLDRLLEPVHNATPDPDAAVTVPPPPAGAARTRVLLAEDNPINALLATKALERLGATVVHAPDGLAALARVAEAIAVGATFDLALIDIRMPGLDGLETARRIRAAEAAAGLGRLHLVALTANAGRDDEDLARRAGFDGFLAKPLNLRVLPTLLGRAVAA